MIVITPTNKFGIYKQVTVAAKGLTCDGSFLPFSVIGTDYEISEDDALMPLKPAPAPAILREKLEVLQRDIISQTQDRLDVFARLRGYDGILSACTYVTSQIQKFAQEGQIAVQARDATWAKLYQILADVETHKRPVPTCFADVEADLPALNWE